MIRHNPVMLEEVISILKPATGKIFLDATLGDAGHTQALLEQGSKVIAFEQDEDGVKRAIEFLKVTLPNLDIKVITTPQSLDLPDLLIINANFTKLSDFLTPLNLKLDGALFDLGVSTHQLTDPSKGLSFSSDVPLDMRLDKSLGVTAADLLKILSEKELKRLFLEFADETYAPAIAKKIVLSRTYHPLLTTKQLADLVAKVKPRGKTNPATKVFQALRIAVNSELDNLRQTLSETPSYLKPASPLAVISFHSGEDRIVKEFLAASPSLLAKEPLTPSPSEIINNPKSRSARLRAATLK